MATFDTAAPGLRVVTLLPSATEIVCALGLRDRLVGITHECDYPGGLAGLPRLTASLIPAESSSHDIDQAVRDSLRADAHSVYALDVAELHTLAPDVIITQMLCEVCAVPAATVEAAICTMPHDARVLSLDPLGIEAILTSISDVADALGVPGRGLELVARLRAELATIEEAVAGAPSPTIFAVEWLDPMFCGGHWVPEMISMAGGVDALGAAKARSRVVTLAEVARADPDLIVLMPCGFDTAEVIARYSELANTPGFPSLRAVRQDNVYAVDATAYFSRPGPRVVEGVRLLARLLHPDRVPGPLPPGTAQRLVDGSFTPVV